MGGDLGSGSGGGSVLGGGALCTGAVARNNSRGKQKKHSNDRNIAKGTTDPRVEFKSQVITQILIKQIQNFD